ncbi:NFX1-type zinc finger-containing protein 1-like [Thrips palmi]|uniref:NFX1-type zinc finger-containing protein 1-like n=1 Tax=Thrips palmi TaxID=161013 RepID=A0A6P8Y945_THRPL|nr:NFX1-type zinc finger-containing protein 1-like [Thrips palmi]XP_034236171.1 NFX1-type zinc finger-containing protein 1-like [Thrips palmi]XP_034236172.1 NFX1-type zinc finger-containing protein 1-like [Thrips palmi]XP_034236173.1 NFX1-type zinc finger-containing protein 1-like [Thrips palmi]XP_034236174.1 NFX1-type zinc finger-containing protein 1-like [Thrips palmi]XP_034236175.1 NFX1-type zinc finger-containing protein 1-like [Thrips palmi]XP_034236176.1 NFX1-type zinc finger-containing
MAIYKDPLFPTPEDLNSDRSGVQLPKIHKKGPFLDHDDLLQTHIDLLSEDFLRSLREQLDDIRANPRILDSTACYTVKAARVISKERSRFDQEAGVEMRFDPTRYQHVRWEEDQRFLTGNIVLLTQDKKALNDFVVGVVHESRPALLRDGRVVLKLVRGVTGKGDFLLLNQASFVGETFTLFESAHFYFPYLHVTNALRQDLSNPMRTLADFEAEIVRCKLPSRPPKYHSYMKAQAGVLGASNAPATDNADALLEQFKDELNESQMAALEKVLCQRVALVQGPPGTGKTYLGCKIAQYFVELKKDRPYVFPGPILVVTTTNHAVHEFLTRCISFTEKIIHGYSDKHEQTSYGPLQERYDRCQSLSGRVSMMKTADILAMTTTRAAYMRSALDKLSVKIVIVEEACEAPEGYILACIPDKAEHLIQIGDHKQLRPNCAHQLLSASHHLDVSLFERLVNNGADCPMLNEQRRMRPQIADLVRCIYPSLTDHATTLDRPAIIGVDLAVPVFFLSRSVLETQDGKGYFNSTEAELAAELANYFLIMGYPPTSVTILTTYRKQMSHILRHVRQIGGDARSIRVTTVDNFQGEENDIIILSLVRSNNGSGIGFLKLENRACVALSRARDGFFLLGNLDCLAGSGAPVWRHVRSVLSEAGRVGDVLPLVCPHGKKVAARCRADVQRAGVGCAVCQAHSVFAAAMRELRLTTDKMAAVSGEVDAAREQLDGEWVTGSDRADVQELVAVGEAECRRLGERLAKQREAVRLAERKWADFDLLHREGRVDVYADSVEAVERKLRAPPQPDKAGKLNAAVAKLSLGRGSRC